MSQLFDIWNRVFRHIQISKSIKITKTRYKNINTFARFFLWDRARFCVIDCVIDWLVDLSAHLFVQTFKTGYKNWEQLIFWLINGMTAESIHLPHHNHYVSHSLWFIRFEGVTESLDQNEFQSQGNQDSSISPLKLVGHWIQQLELKPGLALDDPVHAPDQLLQSV